MELENLPYQPIVFIKTGVIGGTESKEQQIHSQFDFVHRHIVLPKNIENHNLAFYVLFHTASVYNWLRTVPCKQTTLLANYLAQQGKKNVSAMLSKPNAASIVGSLQEYSRKWEVMKKTFSSTVYINKVKESGHQICQHLPKTQQKCILLSQSNQGKALFCPQIFCKYCRRQVKVESEVRELSSCFVSKYGSNQITNVGVRYQAYIVFGKNEVIVKAANQIWYSVNSEGKSRVVGLNSIDFKSSILTVFEKERRNQGNFSIAPPIQNSVPEYKKKTLLENTQKMTDQKDEVQEQNAKSKQKMKTTKGQKFELKQSKQKIKQLKFQPNPILLKDPHKNENYVSQVSKKFDKPKQKDEYELDYDRGKKKKKKEHREYIQPDYNEIHNKVKAQEHEMIGKEGKKIQKKEKFKEKKKKNFIKGFDSD